MITASRLASIAQRPRERCELCAAALPEQHAHLLEPTSRDIRCACGACAILFDRPAAAGGRLRRIPDRRWRLAPGDDRVWNATGMPVDLGFLIRHDSGPAVYYPGPAGVVDAEIDPAAWRDLLLVEPALSQLEPEVEALLVRRHDGRSERYLVPVDDCFRLVATMRAGWRGMWGGRDVWDAIDGFFERLARVAKVPAPARLG